MAKAKTKKINVSDAEVSFITAAPVKPGVQLHSDKGERIVRKVSEVREDWVSVIEQVSFIVSDTDGKMNRTGFALDEITIGLGFSAKGKLAFIAEAGIEASIEIKLKRK